MKKFIFNIFCYFVLCAQPALADVYASVEKDTVGLRENIILNIRSDEQTTAQPDLSVLKNLFNVVSTSVSKQTYIVNGQTNHEINWRFSLLPLKKGKLIIEPIVVGSQKTNPVEVNVSDNNVKENTQNINAQSQEPIYQLEAQIISPKNKKPYIQQQINYSIKLTDDGSLQIENIGFETTDDFIIKELQRPRVHTLENGKREITFLYAVFALKSGILELPKAHIQAFVYQKPAIENIFENNLFSFQMPSVFGIQTPVSLVSDKIQITVLPAPQNYNGKWWLPTKNLSLEARYTNMPKSIRVGDIFKREIILKAVGLTGEQLPQIEIPSGDDLKQYPEKPQTETIVVGSDVVGTLRFANVYIPQKAGEITLPEIKINWYDLSSKQIKTAILKQETIHVLKNVNIEENQTVDTPAKKTNHRSPKEHTKTRFLNILTGPYSLFFMAFICGMLVCYVLLKPKKEKKQPKEKDLREQDVFSSVKNNDLKALRNQLILWAQTNNKNQKITNLKDVADILGDADFSKAVNDLSATLYDDKAQASFNMKAFQKTFKKALKNKRKASKNKNMPIPPLYF